MTSMLEFLLEGEIPVDVFIRVLQCNISGDDVPEKINDQDLHKVRQEFIPFFLNYLRDQTLHLLQSCKSTNPSPAKTPCSQQQKKETRRSSSSATKRIQLFGASPLENTEDSRVLSGSCFSQTSSDVVKTTNSRQEYNNNASYSRNSHVERSKHRFSLGEFFVSPDANGNARRKNSPFSGGRRGDRSAENSPSPMHMNVRQSGGKKRHSLDSPVTRKSQSPAPVFCLNNSVDFPPMGGDTSSKPITPGPRLSDFMTTEKGDLQCMILKNSPNFENSPLRMKAEKQITKSRRISFSTLSSPQDGSGDGVQSPSRRIKPTPVTGRGMQHKQSKAFLSSPVEDKENDKDTEASKSTGFEDEKTLLRQERAKRQQLQAEGNDQGSTSSPGPVTPSKFSFDRGTSVVEIVQADPDEVTCRDKLDILIDLYAQCFRENLFPNITEELYFLLQILTCHHGDSELLSHFGLDAFEQNYFTTVHNAVYFAVRVLENQTSFLQYMDKSTIRLLLENARISRFSLPLKEWLMETAAKSSQQSKLTYPKSPIGSVSFQAETDNRKNFPSDQSFHLFKKQRDCFYELLREWEASHMLEGWSVLDNMRDKVRMLFNYKTDLANHLHFSRLFQSQLIAMCKEDGNLTSSTGDENIAFLSQLKRSNPDKYKRLQERFIRPMSVGGPCPPPSFPGCQEFFHDFVIAASSPVFNQHLTDTFAAKITELNEISLSIAESEDTNTEDSDDEQKEVFVASLITLRLLGKFLGFVTFLPYQTLSKLPDDTHAMYVTLRKNHLPQVDLCECLRSAYREERLSLTVPWIVEFLSMMDVIAPNVEYFRLALFLLLYIHKHSWRGRESQTGYENVLITTTISWLLQNSAIPDGFFFCDIPESVILMMKPNAEKSNLHLDRMGFVDQNLLHRCCPYLGELKTLLVDFSVGSSSKTSTIRKITPVSADDTPQPSVSEKQIQLQLEENFFHNHPASMKRCVEFVAERTASNFIKKFRSTMLQKSIADSKIALAKHIESQLSGSPSGKAKDKLQYDILRISQEHVSQVKAQAAEEVESYCSSRIVSLLPLLLPDEQSQAVVTMTTEISLRVAQEKVKQWIDKHIQYSMYQPELVAELDKLIKQQLQNQSKLNDLEPDTTTVPLKDPQRETTLSSSQEHTYQVRSPSDVLIDVKEVLKGVMLKGQEPEVQRVEDLLQEVQDVVRRREDLQPEMHKTFGTVVMDLTILLICNFPSKWPSYNQDQIFGLWMEELRTVSNLPCLVSCRVMEMLWESPSVQSSWDHYCDLLIKILSEKLITFADLQKKCLTVLSTEQQSVEQLGNCLCNIVEHFNKTEKSDEVEVDLGEALDWIYQLAGDGSPITERILSVLELNAAPCDTIDEDDESKEKVVALNQGCDQSRESVEETCAEENPVHIHVEDSDLDVADKENCHLVSNSLELQGKSKHLTGKVNVPKTQEKTCENSKFVIDTKTLDNLHNCLKLSE